MAAHLPCEALRCSLRHPAANNLILPPPQKTNLNLLVVDGMLNSAAGSTTTFRLSRTQKIGDTVGSYTPGSAGAAHDPGQRRGMPTTFWNRATVSIRPRRFPSTRPRNTSCRYETHNGNKYLSDPVPVLTSPPHRQPDLAAKGTALAM